MRTSGKAYVYIQVVPEVEVEVKMTPGDRLSHNQKNKNLKLSYGLDVIKIHVFSKIIFYYFRENVHHVSLHYFLRLTLHRDTTQCIHN